MVKRTLSILSEPKFGEDEADYFRRQKEERYADSIPLMELREACRLKYKQMEIDHLLEKLKADAPTDVVSRALTLLLKEVFFL